MQLRVIKNKHDETKQKVKQKEKELEQLQKDIAQITVQEQ
jgi:peptidoglycan hydrolase CwlO-like protein